MRKEAQRNNSFKVMRLEYDRPAFQQGHKTPESCVLTTKKFQMPVIIGQ